MTKAKELSELASAATVTSGNVALSGGLDVDGVTDLDVVDIDGAVNMATTLLVTGNVDFNGDLDVDGTTNLDVVDIDGAVDMASTLAVAGNVTASVLVTTSGRFINATDSYDPWLKGINSSGTETSFIKKDGFGYFGGGVAIGGTGAANTLEDYEEGAVSLALVGGNGNPSTAVAITGTYVKIGRSVNVRVLSTSFNNTGAAGPIALTGFPFASAGAYGIGSIGETSDMMTFTNSPFIVVSGDAGYIYQNISEANAITVNHHIDTACSFIMNVTYETNA